MVREGRALERRGHEEEEEEKEEEEEEGCPFVK